MTIKHEAALELGTISKDWYAFPDLFDSFAQDTQRRTVFYTFD